MVMEKMSIYVHCKGNEVRKCMKCAKYNSLILRLYKVLPNISMNGTTTPTNE